MPPPEAQHLEIEVARPGPVARVLMALLRLYQRVISPPFHAVFGAYAGCRFSPTCSHYAIEALATHGALRGLALALWRILRCSPLSKGGPDPVPPRRQTPTCNRA